MNRQLREFSNTDLAEVKVPYQIVKLPIADRLSSPEAGRSARETHALATPVDAVDPEIELKGNLAPLSTLQAAIHDWPEPEC